MTWRFLSYMVCQAAGAVLGWWLVVGDSRWLSAALMALAGGYVWLVCDTFRAGRFLRWLRAGIASELVVQSGVWGEMLDRTRKLLRDREQAGAESEARLQEFLAAMQASPNGVVLLDRENRIEWFNQMAGAHFGLDPRRDLLQIFGNLVRDPSLSAYFAERDFDHDVVLLARGSSTSKPIRVSVQLHTYGAGRCLLLSRDVTALEQAEAMRRDFVANVSHEIRTPLTVLSGFVETLQTLPVDSTDRARYLALMAQQAQRMQTLVTDLLTLSRLEGSPLPSSGEWTPIAALVAQCVQDAQDLSTVLSGHPRECLSVTPSPAIEIAGSSQELMSAFSNLVINAIRYTPPDRAVALSWTLGNEGQASFSVRDEGPGIAPEHVPRLTERFYRVDRSRSRETGGTGLGLAIVKHVAQRHGGELHIESVQGRGSTFTIKFPASRVRAVNVAPLVHA